MCVGWKGAEDCGREGNVEANGSSGDHAEGRAVLGSVNDAAGLPLVTGGWEDVAAGSSWKPDNASALLNGSACEATGACKGIDAAAAVLFDGKEQTAEVLGTGVTWHGRMLIAGNSSGL